MSYTVIMTRAGSAGIIRTDKWSLTPSREQRRLLALTVKEYRKMCRYLSGVVMTHWADLGGLTSNQVVPAVERLMHSTAKNPVVKYAQFCQSFYKFPSYYRRAAISFVVGQVSSFMCRYEAWRGGQRKRRTAKPPTFTPESGCYPSLYKGQCLRLVGDDKAEIKIFSGTDWVWTTVQISAKRERHQLDSNKMLSPALILNSKSCHLSVPFRCKPEKRKPLENVTAVDLGINTTAVVTVVNFDGTVIHREFIHPGRDIDRRDKRLKSISVRAKKTMGRGGKLSKGFCANTYRKCRNINNQISHVVSKQIVDIANRFNSGAVVFENLKGWKARGGRKRSNLKQRFHGWMKARIAEFTQQKWSEVGGKTLYVLAAFTSKLAFDGSGLLRRDSKNYALARFSTGKRYNADLNASLNIAARGIIKLLGRKDQEWQRSKSSDCQPRSWACFCDLWTLAGQG